MSEHPQFEPRTVSVVVTAEFHNPSILNPDFLATREIVPADWTVAETLTTPTFATVKYRNGVILAVDPSRLTVEEDAGPRLEVAYRSHDIACRYLEALPHVPYHSLGLNCLMSVRHADPARWLVERFVPARLRSAALSGIRPTFVLLAEGAVCHIAFQDTEEDGESRIAADCNVHHAGPLDAESIRQAMTRWPERAEFIQSSLTAFCERQHS